MHDSYRHKPRREPPHHRRVSWCCPFTVPPRSPDNPNPSHNLKSSLKSEPTSKSINSFPNSPQSAKLSLVGRIDPRRILSPGRVSPIDSDAATTVDESIQEIIAPNPAPVPSRSPCRQKLPKKESSSSSSNSASDEGSLGIYDVRLNLKGKNGVSLVLELNSEVLSDNSSVFADLIADYRKGSSGSSPKFCRIEVPEVENLNVFRETIELMFEEDITKRLLKIGVYRAIDILEVSAGITFNKAVSSCLKYLEAMPWTEEEEEKLRSLFAKYKFDNSTSKDILSRLYSLNNDSSDSQQTTLSKQLVSSITKCTDTNAKNELKPLVKNLLCRSSSFVEDIYIVCKSCIKTLVSLFQEDLPLIERISKEVDNINWLMEILLDRQMADAFVILWADQEELIRLHDATSAMVRYELSRVTAVLFIAMGTRKMHCQSGARLKLLEAWFGPMLKDFGWLRRCRKGLDVKILEEAMGQTLLTLPLKHQYVLFMEWFSYFSKYGTECPNLSRSFQIWWRRSFLRGESESYAVESR